MERHRLILLVGLLWVYLFGRTANDALPVAAQSAMNADRLATFTLPDNLAPTLFTFILLTILTIWKLG